MNTPHPFSRQTPPGERQTNKVIAVFSLSTDDWPPPLLLCDALKVAADSFALAIKVHLGNQFQGAITCDTDSNPPNPHLN